MEIMSVPPPVRLPETPLAEVDAESTLEPQSLAPAPSALAMPALGALAFALCPTPAEFVAQCEEPGAILLRHRLREAHLPVNVQAALADYPDTLYLLAVVGPGLPDTPAILPLWMRMAAAMPRSDLRIVDDAALPLLERLLGPAAEVDIETLELPALLVFDEEWHCQGSWGPRPQAAEAQLDAWLALHPDYEALAEMDETGETGDEGAQQTWAALTQALIAQMRIWYNSGLDTEAAHEIYALLASLQDAPAEAEA